jgi:hypothetical protein
VGGTLAVAVVHTAVVVAVVRTAVHTVVVVAVVVHTAVVVAVVRNAVHTVVVVAVFVLSAAMMAYLFFYQPVLMILDGRREEAVKFFFKTVGIFAVATAVLLAASIFVRG